MILLKVLLGLLPVLETVLAYNQDTCCELAKSVGAFVGLVPPPENRTCAQQYSPGLPAAQGLFVNYTFCSSQCRGIQLSKVANAGEWAKPLVDFILPSVIFSMTVPRRKQIEFDYLFEMEWPRHATRYPWINNYLQLSISLLSFMVILIPVTIDTVVWISVIVVAAGNMLVGGIYEAQLDYRILKYIKEMAHGTDEDKLRIKRELLVTVASGNLMLGRGSPQKNITSSIMIPNPHAPKDRHEKARSRLLNLLGTQSGFGEQVGAPVLFYLGAFVYTILDILNSPSSEDSALALSFGLQWMIIVHVAIVSGCLLASNNPNTSAGIVGSGHRALQQGPQNLQRRATLAGHTLAPEWTWKRFNHLIFGWSNIHETEYQPVSLWARGSNKMEWIKQTEAWREDPAFRQAIRITWLEWQFKILMPALALSVLPPASGGIVAYLTPPQGVGCRNLVLLIYAASQAIITAIASMRGAVEHNEWSPFLHKLFTGWCFKVLSALFWFGALISAIGGTTLQVIGVFRNCFCKTTFYYWWHDINKTNPSLDLASDTEDARISSRYWIIMGTTATLFIGFTCYCGWWYQRLVRHRFINAVKEMYTPGNFLTTVEGGLGRAGTRDNRNSMDPLLLGNDSAIWSEDGVPVFEPQQLGLGSHSQIRILSPEPLASATSIQTPSFRVSRVSYDGGEDSQLLGFDQITNQRRPRPRANS